MSARCIWLTEAELSDNNEEALSALVGERWEKSPADAAEAVANAYRDYVDNSRRGTVQEMLNAVLGALGYPHTEQA